MLRKEKQMNTTNQFTIPIKTPAYVLLSSDYSL